MSDRYTVIRDIVTQYKRILLAIALLALLILAIYIAYGIKRTAAIDETMGTEASYCDLAADQLFNMLKKKDFTLVNVHIPYEGELPQTDLFIPYTEIDRHPGRLPADKNARIVLYCKTDRMSRIAAERLVELGYTNVCNLDGGMIAWRQKGYSLLNPSFLLSFMRIVPDTRENA